MEQSSNSIGVELFLKAIELASKDDSKIQNLPYVPERKIINKLFAFNERIILDLLPQEHLFAFTSGKALFDLNSPSFLENSTDNTIKLSLREKIFQPNYCRYIDHYNKYASEYLAAIKKRESFADELKKFMDSVIKENFTAYQNGLKSLKNLDRRQLTFLKKSFMNGDIFPTTDELSSLSTNLSKRVLFFRYLFLKILNHVETINKASILSFRDHNITETYYFMSIFELGCEWNFINKFLIYEFKLIILKYKATKGSYLPF